MKITQELRVEAAALAVAEKSAEFFEKGGKLYLESPVQHALDDHERLLRNELEQSGNEGWRQQLKHGPGKASLS